MLYLLIVIEILAFIIIGYPLVKFFDYIIDSYLDGKNKPN